MNIEIPCMSEKQIASLINCAEQTALRYCSSVYLVGSSISKMYPNDIDIFIITTENTYLRLFTNYNKITQSEDDHFANIDAMKIQKAKVYQKQKVYFESKIKGWDFDIKFMHIEQFKQHDGNKIRLDYVYKNLW